MFHRMTLTSPFIVPWGTGAFITYANFAVNRQILMWLDATGTVVNEDSIALPYVPFAYVDGSLAKLICQTDNPWQRTTTFVQRTYDNQGNETRRDTLFVQQLAAGESGLIPGFHFVDGVLTIVAGRVLTAVQPWQYWLRIVQHSQSVTTVFPAWDPGALPQGGSIFGLTVKRRAADSVIGFVAQGGGMTPELRFRSYDEQGQPGSATHTIVLPAWATINGLALVLSGGSVYPSYTAVHREGGQGGAFVAAFPLDQILPVDPRREPPVAQEYSLSAYPNPFNSSVRIEYAVPHFLTTAIEIFDLTGRKVAAFNPSRQAETGSFVWSAADLATGMYIIRLRAGSTQLSQKLLLLR